ncbi:UTP-glucose-1-phosphate uridylyltransferase [Colletotrichum tofieldiae]|nr:UTP-glucose-1-phosphate uridylyltransferase [Colletotrichum tofieldiae]
MFYNTQPLVAYGEAVSYADRASHVDCCLCFGMACSSGFPQRTLTGFARMSRPAAIQQASLLNYNDLHGTNQGKGHTGNAFENTSTSVAAAQMRNALTQLSETVSDPEQKKLFETEMDNFFALFRRYLNDKAKGNAVRFGDAPLIKLGSDFKKVSDFQKHIPSIPKIIELDHLTITGAVNLGRGVTLKGTVIIVATEGSTIDVPPGSILENVVVQGSLRLLEH